MADAPHQTMDSASAGSGLPVNPAPDSKPNWVKDLMFPIIIAAIGFFLGLASDEYKIHSNTPKLRRVEVVQPEAGAAGRYRQKISTTFQPIGRPTIPHLVITANAANPSVHIIDEQLKLEPNGQKPQVRQLDDGGNTDSIRSLQFTNFHQPQSVTWSIDAETSSPLSGAIVRFNYEGVNNVQDGHNLAWEEGLPLLSILLILIAYSSVATVLALYFRSRSRVKHP